MSRLSLIVMCILLPAVLCLAQVNLIQREHQIEVLINGKPVTSFLYEPDMPKPALFPLNTPSGIALTRGYPLQTIAGESQDHPHHYGLFFTCDEVNNEGFWNTTKIPPQIKLIKVAAKSGKQGKIRAVMHWLARSGKTLLQEQRDMIFHSAQDYYCIDFSIKLTAQDTAVVFNDTKEGLFAIRVADWLTEKSGNAEYFNSNGELKEKGVWGKRAAWVCLHGNKEGKPLGIVIINHPASVNYPTFWHARGYGLFAANPLGQLAFEKELGQDDAKPLRLTLQRGQSAWFKFRVVVYEREMGKADIDEIAAQYFKMK